MENERSNSTVSAEQITPIELRKRLMYAVLGSLSLSDDVPELIPTSRIYSIFQQLQPRYPRWLGPLYFESSKEDIICKDLEDILFYLGAFGLLTVENHDFKCLRFTKKDRIATKDNMKSRIATDKSLQELEGLASAFSKLVRGEADVCTR